jgi:hypothetical protein
MLTDYQALDYTGNAYIVKYRMKSYYAELASFDVVNLKCVTMMVFKMKNYRYLGHYSRKRFTEEIKYLMMDSRTKDLVLYKENDPWLRRIEETDWFSSHIEGELFQFLRNDGFFAGKKCRVIMRLYKNPEYNIKYGLNSQSSRGLKDQFLF